MQHFAWSIGELVVTETQEATAEATADASPPVAEEVVSSDPEVADATSEVIAEGATSEQSEVIPDVAEDAAPEVFPGTLTELREKFPELAEAAEYAGAQRETARLRKEMGSEQSTQARLIQYAAHIEQHGSDPEQLKVIIQDRDLNAMATVMRSIGQQALEVADLKPSDREAKLAELEKLSGGDLNSFAAQLWHDSHEASASSYAATLTLADVPEDSTLRSEITAEVQRLYEEELLSRAKEAKAANDPAPAIPQGGVSAGLGPTAEQYRAASRSQRQQWRKDGVEIRA